MQLAEHKVQIFLHVPFTTFVCNQTQLLSGPTCLVADNVVFYGNGHDGGVQTDWQTCLSFCVSNYPNSAHFTYSKVSQNCWCKSDYTEPEEDGSAISGEVTCTFQQGEINISGTINVYTNMCFISRHI